MDTLKGYTDRTRKWILQKIFGFDKWHITSLSQRKYAIDIIGFSNNLPVRNSACEIGCGLGDIIRNLHFKRRIGLDIDLSALKAAAFISKFSGQTAVDYSLFEFPEERLKESFDVIVMVNWIHHIQPIKLKEKLSEFFQNNLNDKGVLIIDTVQDESYEFNHDINFLTNTLNCEIVRIGEYARRRETWAIKKNI